MTQKSVCGSRLQRPPPASAPTPCAPENSSQQLAADDERRKTAGQIAEEIRRQEAVCKTWSTLNALIGSHDGKRYREFVQGH